MANVRVPVSYDRSAPRRPVNLSLNEDLVARAKKSTRNLSATVEELLAGYVQQEQAGGGREAGRGDLCLERVP